MSKIIISGIDQSPQWVQSKMSQSKIRRVLDKVYTDDFDISDEEFVRKYKFDLIQKLLPGVVISHRSANDIYADKNILIVTRDSSATTIKWPGLTIDCQKGMVHEKDTPFGSIYISSMERRLLENLQQARQQKALGGLRKTVDQSLIEKELCDYMVEHGEDGLNDLRDRCRSVANDLSMDKEYTKLSNIISSILSTGSDDFLKSELSKSFSKGIIYDEQRYSLFTEFALYLSTYGHSFSKLNVSNEMLQDNNRIFAFYEAYFSNYIEGTKFEVDEAEDIVFNGLQIPNRSKDTHDIKGTFDVVNDEYDKSYTPTSFDEFIDMLKKRHQQIMQARPDALPGEFKVENNKAGNTHFVDHNFVTGTLQKAYELYQSIPEGFPRAAYIMFVISEIHPFTDGNGRVARIFMNAELSNINDARIIIPTYYREDYLRNLRALTRNHKPKGFLSFLRKSQLLSLNLPVDKIENSTKYLIENKAFLEEEK